MLVKVLVSIMDAYKRPDAISGILPVSGDYEIINQVVEESWNR